MLSKINGNISANISDSQRCTTTGTSNYRAAVNRNR